MGEAVRFTESERKRLLEYLKDETDYALRSVYEPLKRKRDAWNDSYFGKTRPRAEKWMSNFPILFGATCTDAILSRVQNTTWAYTPIYTYKPLVGKEWPKVAHLFEKYVDFQLRHRVKMYRQTRKSFFEMVRLGTGALLTPWIIEEDVRVNSVLGVRLPRRFLKTNFVHPRALPIRDLLYPGGYSEVEELPWWARVLRWDEMMLRRAAHEKYYENIDKVIPGLKDGMTAREDETQEAAVRAGELPEGFGRTCGWEHWLWFSRRNNGAYEKFVVTWDPKTDTILRIEEDTYPSWPLLLFRYGPRDYGICGLGVIEMTLPYDNALWALYNTLVDNFQIATMQLFKGRKQAGLSAQTDIYPGKLFLLDDPMTDLTTMPMGNPFMLNPQFLRMMSDLGERRTGINDYALGRESPIVGRHATATGTLALIQEGQRRHDLTIRDLRDSLDDLGEWILTMSHRHLKPRQLTPVLGPDGNYVAEYLTLPQDDPRGAFAVVSGISNVSLNKEVEKANAQQSFAILGQYYDKVFQAVVALGNPQVPDNAKAVIVEMLKASQTQVQRLLETLGEPSPGEYTNVIAPLLGDQSEAFGLGGPPPQPGMEADYGTLEGGEGAAGEQAPPESYTGIPPHQ